MTTLRKSTFAFLVDRLPIKVSVFCLIFVMGGIANAANEISFSYGGITLSSQEEAEAKQFTKQNIDRAISGLQIPIPQYPAWIAAENRPANPNMDGSERLKIIAEHHVRFSREQIDAIIPALNHIDQIVRMNIVTALDSELGLWIDDHNVQWFNVKDYGVRRPYVEAWTEFWKQNRDRYAAGKSYIVNGLSLDAKCAKASTLTITMTNHSKYPIRICTEVAGKWSRYDWEDKIKESNLYGAFPYSIVLQGEGNVETHPVRPRELVMRDIPAVLPLEQEATIPDREVHCEVITIPAGGAFNYEMDLNKAFPKLNLSGRNLVVRYDFHAGSSDVESASLWEGQLQSAVVSVGGG